MFINILDVSKLYFSSEEFNVSQETFFPPRCRILGRILESLPLERIQNYLYNKCSKLIVESAGSSEM